MAGKPQDARHGGASWAGMWRTGGRVSAARLAGGRP
jgi:hypothetical protein